MFKEDALMMNPKDTRAQLINTKNIKISLAEIQLAAWKQMQLINRTPVEHNHILIFSWPKYSYDYSQYQPAKVWINMIWSIEKQAYGLQLQQELLNDKGDISLYNETYSHQEKSIAKIAKIGFEIHQAIGQEIELALYPDFDAMIAGLLK